MLSTICKAVTQNGNGIVLRARVQTMGLLTQGTGYLNRLWRARLYRPDLTQANRDSERHLREALGWLCRAHDAGDQGVAYGAKFGRPFLESYPETTGYIIPTFLSAAENLGDPSLAKRAHDMGLWECQVQMDCGAVMAGAVTNDPVPAVFNTGMVLLGWSALYERGNDSRFLESLMSAGEHLIALQENAGDWRQGNSPYAHPRATVYNVKAAWGLCEAGRVADWPAAIRAAERNGEWCLTRQLPNGWFADCALQDPDRPLLHTLAYAMQGLLGIGIVTQREDFIKAAQRTADSLMAHMDDDGFLPGRIDQEFHGASSWCCLTGTAQTAVVWGRLFRLTGRTDYRDAMDRALSYLLARHDITNADVRLRGGVPGSWPVWGEYAPLMVVNWATNFLVEALLIRRALN